MPQTICLPTPPLTRERVRLSEYNRRPLIVIPVRRRRASFARPFSLLPDFTRKVAYLCDDFSRICEDVRIFLQRVRSENFICVYIRLRLRHAMWSAFGSWSWSEFASSLGFVKDKVEELFGSMECFFFCPWHLILIFSSTFGCFDTKTQNPWNFQTIYETNRASFPFVTFLIFLQFSNPTILNISNFLNKKEIQIIFCSHQITPSRATQYTFEPSRTNKFEPFNCRRKLMYFTNVWYGQVLKSRKTRHTQNSHEAIFHWFRARFAMILR